MPEVSCGQALAAAQALGLPRLDAQLLVLHALGQPESARAWLLAHDGDPMPPAAGATLEGLVKRRMAGEPLAYIVGHKEFFGLRLQVDRRVLVPRPDTETLVAWGLDCAAAAGFSAPLAVLDLGTGSGAIALALAHGLRQAGRSGSVLAVDASADALAVARENARLLGLDVDFLQSNWLEQVSARFHLILSNPPYIRGDDPHLPALAHEPLQALVAGPDGLDDIRRVIDQAPRHLAPGGWLLLEHGYDQSQAVQGLLRQAGFVSVQGRRDLAGIDRCSGGQWPG
ncbi:MAG: [protein release factor]-glutamine N5-methyltransferase [Polaromonas sp.]|nr:[protein release factor]-glutamine N5-methyltransferase [Polaromonas sp.]